MENERKNRLVGIEYDRLALGRGEIAASGWKNELAGGNDHYSGVKNESFGCKNDPPGGERTHLEGGDDGGHHKINFLARGADGRPEGNQDVVETQKRDEDQSRAHRLWKRLLLLLILLLLLVQLLQRSYCLFLPFKETSAYLSSSQGHCNMSITPHGCCSQSIIIHEHFNQSVITHE